MRRFLGLPQRTSAGLVYCYYYRELVVPESRTLSPWNPLRTSRTPFCHRLTLRKAKRRPLAAKLANVRIEIFGPLISWTDTWPFPLSAIETTLCMPVLGPMMLRTAFSAMPPFALAGTGGYSRILLRAFFVRLIITLVGCSPKIALAIQREADWWPSETIAIYVELWTWLSSPLLPAGHTPISH